jgi:lipopolysaccharide transport system permease protein
MSRDLLALLVRRDVTLRYKQSALGLGWAIVQPLVLMTIFSIVFGHFAKLPSDGVPYPVLALTGLIPWQYFSRSLTGASDSLVGSSNLVSKVYFPRLILPISKTLSGIVDFGIAFLLLMLLLAWYRITPGWQVVFLPFFVLGATVTAFSVGVWLTALNVRYRDISLLIPFLVQVWMYASPIAYSTSLVPEEWRWAYGLNPIVGIVEGFRWALLRKQAPDWTMVSISFGVVVLILCSGLAYFRSTEREFADII